MRRPQGYVQVVGGVSEREFDTVTCGHCNQIVLVKPGTALTTYLLPHAVGPHTEEPGACCRVCMRAVCLTCHADGRCTPLERRIEQMEARGRFLSAVGLAVLCACGAWPAQAQPVNAGGRLTGVGLTVTITAPTSSPTYDASTASAVTVSGTWLSDRTVNTCTYTDDLGGSGSAVVTGGTWSVSSLALTVGTNTVTVTCTNTAGTTGQDVLAVTRSSGSGGLTPTIFLATTGSDANSCTTARTSTTPKASFASVWPCMVAGDVLQVGSGTYASASPPQGTSGSAGNPMVVQAQTDGGVTITGGLLIHRSSYLTFIGLKVVDTSLVIYVNSNNSVGNISHHITFQKIGWECSSSTVEADPCFAIGDGAHDILIEDSWGWGGTRYTLSCYGGNGGADTPNPTCDNNVFRRLVLRQGPNTAGGGQPASCLVMYYASNNIIENVICLDSTHSAVNAGTSDFYLTQHASNAFGGNVHTDSNKYYGLISLNNTGTDGCWWIDVDQGGTASNNEVHHHVCWNTPGWGSLITCSSSTANGNIVDHATTYSAGNSGWENACGSTQLTSSLLIANGDYGAFQEGTGSVGTHDYNYYFGNGTGPRNNVSAETHTSTTCNPAFTYPLRVEVGNCAAGAAADGSNLGATIVKRYQNGVLTATDLWPWPNEARIKTEMCGGGPGSTVGWCAGSKTLTKYVWEFNGGTSPY